MTIANTVARGCLVAACALATSGAAHAATPDLSGIWETPFKVHSSGLPLFAGATPWIAVSKGDPAQAHIPTIDELSAATDKSVREHHGNPQFGFPRPPAPPLNAAGHAAAAAMDLKAVQARELDCYPANIATRAGGSPIQITQGRTSLAIESDTGLGRTIFLDGRDEADALPQWNGHSLGTWHGDTLMVHTTKIRGEEFGFGNWPMDDNATLEEDYHLAQGGKQLVLRETFTDPTYYTEPVRRLVYYSRAPDTHEVLDYTCTEGKTDMIETQSKAQP